MTGFQTNDGYTYFVDEVTQLVSCPMLGISLYYCMCSIINCCPATFMLPDGTTYTTSGIVVGIF